MHHIHSDLSGFLTFRVTLALGGLDYLGLDHR